MRTLDQTSTNGFSFLVKGNGGESQLIIAVSPGQSGRSVIIAVEMEIDMGGKLALHTHLATVDVVARVDRLLTSWCRYGIAPSASEWEEREREVKRAVRRFAAWMHMGVSA